jgi:uncharacterized membrane protein YhaH (DUF805 family)
VNRRFGWSDLLLSASGRLARTPFWIASAILIGLATIYEVSFGPPIKWLTGWCVYPALIYMGACVLSKRLHDRGRSGWWAALLLFALVAVWPTPHGFGAFVFVLILGWATIELGVMQGEDGANRFGPSPLTQMA